MSVSFKDQDHIQLISNLIDTALIFDKNPNLNPNPHASPLKDEIIRRLTIAEDREKFIQDLNAQISKLKSQFENENANIRSENQSLKIQLRHTRQVLLDSLVLLVKA